MRKYRILPLTVLALMLSLAATSTALAGEAIQALRGDWLIEPGEGEQLPPNMQMKMTFVDDDTLRMTIVMDGQVVGSEEGRYAATADGKMTMYEDNGTETDCTWEVKADGKLYLTGPNPGGQPETIVMRRP